MPIQTIIAAFDRFGKSSVDCGPRTRIVFLHRFDRANRGLLTEATATETAGASLATGTKRRSASALAAISRRTAPNGRKKDEIGVVGMEETSSAAVSDWTIRSPLTKVE